MKRVFKDLRACFEGVSKKVFKRVLMAFMKSFKILKRVFNPLRARFEGFEKIVLKRVFKLLRARFEEFEKKRVFKRLISRFAHV